MGLQNWESGACFLHCRHRQVVRVLDSEGNVRVSIKIAWGRKLFALGPINIKDAPIEGDGGWSGTLRNGGENVRDTDLFLLQFLAASILWTFLGIIFSWGRIKDEQQPHCGSREMPKSLAAPPYNCVRGKCLTRPTLEP